MNTPLEKPARPGLHPLVATAAVSVTAFSLTGIAWLTGLLPHDSTTTPATPPTTSMASTPSTTVTPPAAPITFTPVAPPVETTNSTGTESPAKSTNAPTHRTETEKTVSKSAATTTVSTHKAATHPATSRVANPAPAMTPAVTTASLPPDSPPPAPRYCGNCGEVVSVQAISIERPTSGGGAIAGAIIGGVLAHQMGKGHGRDAMTAAGAIGGAMAGNQMEKSGNSSTRYDVLVHLQDGSQRSFSFDSLPDVRSGDRIRVEGGTLMHDD